VFKNRNILLVVLALVLFSFIPLHNTAEAHTTLKESTPSEGEEVKDPISSIELIFTSKIENGSTVNLENEQGEEITPESTNINDNTLDAEFDAPLEPGKYQVNWKAISKDGHVMENSYSFSIANIKDSSTDQIENSQASVEMQTANKVQAEQQNSISNNQDNNQQNLADPQAKSENTAKQPFPPVYWIIILLIIVLIIALLITKVRKRN
jgi:hypothetical protein